ncbi:MAG: metallophosphoesterase family protein [Alkaliphilus sp.]
MFKFIHIADVHLDTHFLSKDKELRKKLRESLRDAFNRAIDLCIEEKVNALLTAGDLFDNDNLSFETEKFLIDSFERLRKENITVIYATGNHDPGDDAYRVNRINWPKNVHVIKTEEVKIVDMADAGGKCIAKVVSVGHKTSKESRNLIKKFPNKEAGATYVGLAHASVVNAFDINQHDKYLPTSINDLETKNYDYWALGHIHKRQRISGLQEIHYSGNIQGRHPRETGIKGGLLVTIDNDNVSVEFKQLSSIRWETITIGRLAKIKSYEELKNKIIVDVLEYIENNNCDKNNLIARIGLEGRCPLKNELEEESNLEELENDIKNDLDLLGIEVKTDRLTHSVDVDNYAVGNHVLSEILGAIKNFEKNDELMDRLSKIGFISSEVKKNNKQEYIKEIIKGLDVEIVSRMVGEKK